MTQARAVSPGSAAMSFRAVLVVLTALGFGAAPLITPPFTGYDPAQFRVFVERPAIQPAGWAFSIWGLIYLGLAAHALFGLFARRTDAGWDRPRVLLATALLVGSFWLWIAPRDPWLATLGLWVMMAAAIGALLRMPVGRGADRWIGVAPLALFAGWLTAAMNVSLGVVIAGSGVMPDTAAALLMLATTLAIALAVQWRKPRVPEYGATVIWALAGIVAVNLTAPVTPNPTVAWAAAGGAAVMALTLLVVRRRV
jgi:hypothetical protein